MTDEDEAFLRAICDQPEDDLPRLVYADYLEERGQPERAELIRVQCEIDRLPESDPDWPRLRRREKALLQEHEKDWQIPGLRGVQHFNRGFVEVIQTSAEWLLACSAEAFRWIPLRELRLVNMQEFLSEITQLEWLDRVETLILNNNSLGVRDRLGRLLEARPLPRLKRLELRNAMLWPDAVRTLAQSRQARQLHSLDLSGNPVGTLGVEALVQSPMTSLQRLVIRGDELDARECLHPVAAQLLADDASQLKNLRHLDLSDQYLSDQGLGQLAMSRNFTQVQRLLVPYNDVEDSGPVGLPELLESPHWSALEFVDYSGNRVSHAVTQALLRWPALARGARAALVDCDLSEQNERLLATSRWAAQLLLKEE